MRPNPPPPARFVTEVAASVDAIEKSPTPGWELGSDGHFANEWAGLRVRQQPDDSKLLTAEMAGRRVAGQFPQLRICRVRRRFNSVADTTGAEAGGRTIGDLRDFQEHPGAEVTVAMCAPGTEPLEPVDRLPACSALTSAEAGSMTPRQLTHNGHESSDVSYGKRGWAGETGPLGRGGRLARSRRCPAAPNR